MIATDVIACCICLVVELKKINIFMASILYNNGHYVKISSHKLLFVFPVYI